MPGHNKEKEHCRYEPLYCASMQNGGMGEAEWQCEKSYRGWIRGGGPPYCDSEFGGWVCSVDWMETSPGQHGFV